MTDKSYDWKRFGRYALLQKIGAGGMAEIYRAKTFGAAGFEKEFAIKLILPSLVDDTEFVSMFINEAKLTVNLYHANIVQVFDLGELNDQYYIAMEYVHGKDLLYVLARCAELNIKIPLDIALFVAMEMLKGLDFAHRAKNPYGDDLNIIHRDVSPSNIMISYAGDVKVGDFGVAKAAIQRTLTEKGTLKGKVGYMSPEQVMGNEIDSRSDLFSACIVLFEALSMNRLFVGDSDLDVMLKVRDADVQDSIKRAGPMPSQLLDIINKGLSKHRENRFQTGGEFYQALVDFCYQHSIKVTGSDLSNFMRRLFAEEIEKEKEQRRSEPGGEALSREMAKAREQESSLERETTMSEAEEQFPSEIATGAGDVPDRNTPSALELDKTARVDGEDSGKKWKAGIVRGASEASEARDDGEADDERDDASKLYRYRDGSGLVFGPMGPKTLINLLKVRRPRDEDRVSVDEGPWLSLDKVPEIDLGDKLNLKDRRSTRQVSSSEHHSEDRGEAAAAQARESDTDRDHEEPLMAEVIAGSGVGLGDSSTELAPPPEMDESPSSEEEVLAMGHSPVARSAPSEATTDDMLEEPETLQELKQQYASYEGELDKIHFARILARLHLVEETGRLHVQRDDIEKSIYFRDGEPIFAESNKKEELLGQFLRSRDLITESQLEQALDRLSEWGGRLGDALVSVGAVEAHSIFEHLSAQMSEKILDIFDWESGYYGYYENQEPDAQAYSLGLNTYQILVEGCRERVSIERIRQTYKNRSFVSIYVNDPPPFDVDKLGLRARELRVINQLESGDTLENLLAKFSPDQHETVYRTLYLFHQAELYSFEVTEKLSTPALPRVETPEHE